MTTNEAKHVTALVEAALDQPAPTPALKAALNRMLVAHGHQLAPAREG